MKHHNDIRSQILPWIEQKLDAEGRGAIDRHLEECLPCRTYFESISAVLSAGKEIPGPGLVPDPFLPTRIRALHVAAGTEQRPGILKVLVWGWRTAAFVLAVLLGVYMGEKLSVQQVPSNSAAAVTAYSVYLGDGGLAERIHTVTVVAGEELQ